MDVSIYLKSLFALIFDLALIGLAVWAGRRFGLIASVPRNLAGKKRLQVLESITLDQRRRMVLVRRDNTEHLLVLGQEHTAIVETGIDLTATSIKAEDAAEAAPPNATDPPRRDPEY